MPMTCEISQQGTSVYLTLAGIIDEEGAATLKQQFAAIDSSIAKELVIDMGRVSQIGSSGIGKLLLFYKNMAARGGSVRLVSVPQPIFELFTELRLDTLFTMNAAA